MENDFTDRTSCHPKQNLRVHHLRFVATNQVGWLVRTRQHAHAFQLQAQQPDSASPTRSDPDQRPTATDPYLIEEPSVQVRDRRAMLHRRECPH